MRRRLLLVLLTFSALAVTAFAWPLLISTASGRTQRFVIARTEDLNRFAVLAQQASLEHNYDDLREEVRNYHDLYGDGVLVVDDQGTTVAQAGLTRDAGLEDRIRGALTSQPAILPDDLRPWSHHDELFARPVGTDTRVVGAVVVRASVRGAVAEITDKWALILLTAVGAATVCVLLALLLARWVLRPLGELEHGVRALTEGRCGEHIRERGPREMRALAGLFNQMSEVIAESAAQQRRLVADASHELRSPIARLRLPVDALAEQVRPAGREAYCRIVAEIDELESLSTSLLELANADQAAMELAAGTSMPESCDAMELLVERREAWLPTARLAGVTLDAPESTPVVRLACPELELKQVLDVALDNAIKYAGSRARVRMECARGPGCGRIVIIDDGPGLSPQELARATTRFWRSRLHRTATGSGLGLAIAERLVTTWGGALRLRTNQPSGLVVELTLPLAREVAT